MKVQSQSKKPSGKPRGRKRILPKMNNSERGKYYRQKYREHEEKLVQSVDVLRDRVKELEATLAQLRNQQAAPKVPEASFMKVLEQYLASIVHKPLSTRDFEQWTQYLITRGDGPANTMLKILQQWEATLLHHQMLYFELHEFELSGSEDTPVVFAHGIQHTVITEETIASLFPFAQRNERLLRLLSGKQVSYPTRTHFFLNGDGSLVHVEIETDYIRGLHTAFGGLNVAASLACHLMKHHHKNKNKKTIPQPTNATCIRDPVPERPSLASVVAAPAAVVSDTIVLPSLHSMRMAYILS